jgi:hypothetical protein
MLLRPEIASIQVKISADLRTCDKSDISGIWEMYGILISWEDMKTFKRLGIEIKAKDE